MSATEGVSLPFDSLYAHGFVRAAVGLPRVRLGDPAANHAEILSLARQASERQAALIVFPELTLSGYSNDDLFHQQPLLEGCLETLEQLIADSLELVPTLLVGLPLRVENKIFNCAAAVSRGRLLGLVPKTFLPNYREYYEKRYFAPAEAALASSLELFGSSVAFGTDLVFEAAEPDGFVFAVEICEDLWAPVPPTTWGALAGATLLCNLSASNVTVDKGEYRRLLCRAQSGRCVATYLYAGAGCGESTTDLAWDGHGLIVENAEILAESERFQQAGQLLVADVDLDRLVQERQRLSSYTDSVIAHHDRLKRVRRIDLGFRVPATAVRLEREIPRFPFVPSRASDLDERCYETYNIQVHGLVQRLRATGIERVVIGVSGGLDSTQALIVCVRAMDTLGLPHENVLAYTLPGYATTDRTRDNALKLIRALEVSAREIDIRPSCDQMLRDLDHPFARGEPVHDVTFENVQAGERTSHLFRLANHHGALVVGTGDLSEIALGWATYGVGDQMSHYGVNASVPKTLIQHLIRWVIGKQELGAATCQVLQSILDTEISPELIPAGEGESIQSTEERIGPFDLQDFHLYYLTRYGYRPSKVAYLSHHAWGDRERGSWPEHYPPERRRQYDLTEIRRWLEVFLYRFFELSQFKRSAMPNGPKVGSGGSLSPRGDWRAPSDGSARRWLDELQAHLPKP